MKKKKPASPLVDTAELLKVLDTRPLPAAARRIEPENRLPRFDPVNAAGGKKTAAIHILDAISWWTGNDARTFQQRLAALDVEELDVYINSPGGSVFEGVTIYNLLVAHPATVNVHVLGLAASIASVIMLAGDTVNIAENAMVMIHEPSAGIYGRAKDYRQVADVLDKITESILNTYEARTKLTRDQLREAMTDKDTYYTADEAVMAGFATKKVTAMKAAALWNPDDFELVDAAKALAFRAEEEPGEEEEETPEPIVEDVPEAVETEEAEPVVGSLEDVAAAESFLASIQASLSADDS
jgi:ATP-dependent Clp endopeptidase proteolytic subunit ClpP